MSRWFVYYGAEYYPSAQVVEAETAEAAVRATDDGEPLAVFPADAVAVARRGTRDWEADIDDAVVALIEGTASLIVSKDDE